jgi:hypothetical protein
MERDLFWGQAFEGWIFEAGRRDAAATFFLHGYVFCGACSGWWWDDGGVTDADVIMEREEWQTLLGEHRARAQRWTLPTLERRARQVVHPVEDFLFNYYPLKLGKLEQWHPGMGVVLRGAHEDFPQWMEKHYRYENGVLFVDPRQLEEKEVFRLRWTLDLLENTRSQAGNFGCFGMHEWAMVYRTEETRHAKVTGLRLSQQEIAEFVESRPIRCSHYDAFRFFTPPARPLNQLQPSLEGRQVQEQPGCIHANMDLYKWCYKSLPWIDGDLLLDCFSLAMELRNLDMRASPYDLEQYGYEPVRIETVEGRRAYEAEQRELALRAEPLRGRLIEFLRKVLVSREAIG